VAIAMDAEGKTDDRLLDEVQRETFDFFIVETNERNGLVADCTRPDGPAASRPPDLRSPPIRRPSNAAGSRASAC